MSCNKAKGAIHHRHAGACTMYVNGAQHSSASCTVQKSPPHWLLNMTSRHLLVSDVSVDSHVIPSMVAITVKMYKTDQFGKGITNTGNKICPVSAI